MEMEPTQNMNDNPSATRKPVLQQPMMGKTEQQNKKTSVPLQVPKTSVQPATQMQQPQADTTQKPAKKKSKWWLWLLIILGVIIVAGAVYYFLF